jgi:hypothetical protein
MSDNQISGNNLLRAAERVRAKREADGARRVTDAIVVAPVKTTSQVRARLNVMPDSDSLHAIIGNALNALSRGVRWARGSIVNFLV